MQKLLLIFLFLPGLIFSDVSMKKAKKEKPEITLPIEKPIRPIRPVRPVINTGVVYQDNYYNDNYTSSCGDYIELLKEKDATILALQQEVASLRAQAQQQLQQKLKAEYDKEMQKFEKSQSSIKTSNSIMISEEPIE